MLQFWWTALSRAFWDSFLAIESVEGLLYAGVVVLIVAGRQFRKYGWEAVKRRLFKMLAEGLAIGLLAWIPFFSFHLLRSPYLMWSEEVAKVSAAQKEHNETKQELESLVKLQQAAAHRKEMREQIGRFIAAGVSLRDQAATSPFGPTVAKWKKWNAEVGVFLRDNLGSSYEVRFKAVEQEGTPLYSTVFSQIEFLNEVHRDLKD